MKRKRNELDLHGVNHGDVETSLERFFFWEGNSEGVVITGNSKIMKDKVIEWLDSNDFYYFIPSSNTGRIEIQDNIL